MSGDATYDQAKAAYGAAEAHYGTLDSSVADNTIPFAQWACNDFSFPVTPVLVDIAATAPFPDYAQSGG